MHVALWNCHKVDLDSLGQGGFIHKLLLKGLIKDLQTKIGWTDSHSLEKPYCCGFIKSLAVTF